MPKSFNNSDFVHLHCHTEKSSFDGLANLKKFVFNAREMGFPAVAVSDHGTMAGAVQLLKLAKTSKGCDAPPIKPIIGVEAYMSLNRKEKNKNSSAGNHHILLLAQNFQGYKNLCELVDRSWTEGYYRKPRIDMEIFSEYSDGIIASSGCPASIINANLIYGRKEQAVKTASLFKDILGDRFFMELMYHGLDIEDQIIPDILDISKDLDIPAFASNDMHYLHKDDAKTHDVFLSMSQRTCVHNPNRISFGYDEYYMKSANEMGKMFGHLPNLLYNTVAIAEMIDSDDIHNNLFNSFMRLPDPRKVVPEKYFSDPRIVDPEYDPQYFCLWDKVEEGQKKLGWHKSDFYIERIKMEMGDIRVAWEANKMDFATYFLVVEDYISWAKNQGILVGFGRGSAAGAAISACLGITSKVCPQKHGLLWERFLAFQPQIYVSEDDFGFEEKTH